MELESVAAQGRKVSQLTCLVCCVTPLHCILFRGDWRMREVELDICP